MLRNSMLLKECIIFGWGLRKHFENKEEVIYLQMKSQKDYAKMVFYICCIIPRKARRK